MLVHVRDAQVDGDDGRSAPRAALALGRTSASGRARGVSGARRRGSIPIESSSAVARSSSSARLASASGMRSGSSTTTVARRTAVRRPVRRTMHSSAWPVSGSPNRTRAVPASAARVALSITAPRAAGRVSNPRGRRGIGRRTARRRCAPGFDERRAMRPRAATGSPCRAGGPGVGRRARPVEHQQQEIDPARRAGPSRPPSCLIHGAAVDDRTSARAAFAYVPRGEPSQVLSRHGQRFRAPIPSLEERHLPAESVADTHTIVRFDEIAIVPSERVIRTSGSPSCRRPSKNAASRDRSDDGKRLRWAFRAWPASEYRPAYRAALASAQRSSLSARSSTVVGPRRSASATTSAARFRERALIQPRCDQRGDSAGPGAPSGGGSNDGRLRERSRSAMGPLARRSSFRWCPGCWTDRAGSP